MFPSTRLLPCFLILFFIKVTCSAQSIDKINIINEIKIIGNKTTKEYIIIRELPFKVGDTLLHQNTNQLLERTKSNLLNTSLFNFVTAEIVEINNEAIAIYITLEERWYWWPIPIFEVEETNFNTWWKTKNLNRANYGLFLAKENFRGRKERLVFKFQGGYTQLAEVRYYLPYLNKKQTQGLTVGFTYKQNHELIYNTTNNKRDFFKLNDLVVKREFFSRFNYEFRPKLYNKHNIEIQYSDLNIQDSILSLNRDFLSSGNNSSQFFSLAYSFKRDKRNFKSYATKGYYFDLNLIKNGLGIIDDKLNGFYATSSMKKYWQLSDKLYFSSAIKAKASLKRPPFALLTGLGYGNDLVRGYELYVINGQHYGLFKSQLRYALFNEIFQMQNIPFNKFNKVPLNIYPGVFFDTGYVSDDQFKATNFLNNKMLYGGGLSLDFTSYYDLVFRIEYSINQLKEQGLFLHFVAPI